MSPAERAARQMIEDKKAAEATDKAYVRSLTSTEQNPAPAPKTEKKASGGVTGGDPRPSPLFDGLFGGKSSDAPQKAREEAKASSAEGKAMKSGGRVSASSRADGCAQRGKTRGKMV